jgi:hypothetical protein
METHGGVVEAASIAGERRRTDSCVLSIGVGRKRIKTHGSVVVATNVVSEGIGSIGGIGDAGGEPNIAL